MLTKSLLLLHCSANRTGHCAVRCAPSADRCSSSHLRVWCRTIRRSHQSSRRSSARSFRSCSLRSSLVDAPHSAELTRPTAAGHVAVCMSIPGLARLWRGCYCKHDRLATAGRSLEQVFDKVVEAADSMTRWEVTHQVRELCHTQAQKGAPVCTGLH